MATEVEQYTAAIPSGVDATKQHLSYGRDGIPTLINVIEAKDLLGLQRGLFTLCDLLHNPENISSAIASNVIPFLTGKIHNEDLSVRQKSAECLFILSRHANGRKGLLETQTITPLSERLDDPDNLTRKHVYTIIKNLSETPECAQILCDQELLPKFITKLTSEPLLEIQLELLETVYQILRVGKPPHIPHQALDNNLIPALTNFLNKQTVSHLKVLACECLMMICFHGLAKRVATRDGTLQKLTTLLKDWKSDVRAAAAGAIMAITIDVDAKKQFIKDGGVQVLIDCMGDENELVMLNVLKVITNVAEDIRGRMQLSASVKVLDAIKTTSKSAQIAQAARQAIDVICWKP